MNEAGRRIPRGCLEMTMHAMNLSTRRARVRMEQARGRGALAKMTGAVYPVRGALTSPSAPFKVGPP
jgi:hypothetical protein